MNRIPSLSAQVELPVDELSRLFPRRVFAHGAVLRTQGVHYANLFLLIDGRAIVHINQGAGTRQLPLAPPAPIGEIGFLNGCSATATVVADGPVEVLEIDDASLTNALTVNPRGTNALLRALADTSADRLAENTTFDTGRMGALGGNFEVLLCRSADMLQQARRLRYDIYCTELGRTSPHADHQAQIIADDLDAFAHVFIAELDGVAVGTIRVNSPAEGDIGGLAELYGMTTSPHFPDHVGIVTKFVVRQQYRGSLAALKLIAAIARYGDHYDARACYIDCVPPLLHYYRAIGFEVCGSAFLHRENGTSIPMVLDLVRHGNRLKREPGRSALVALYLRARIAKLGQRLATWRQQPD